MHLLAFHFRDHDARLPANLFVGGDGRLGQLGQGFLARLTILRQLGLVHGGAFPGLGLLSLHVLLFFLQRDFRLLDVCVQRFGLCH